jgi:hypothetical protein
LLLEEIDHRLVAQLFGQRQGCLSIRVSGRCIWPIAKDQLCHLDLPVVGGLLQRGEAILLLRVHVRARLQQSPGDIIMPRSDGGMKRRDLLGVPGGGVDLRALLQQQLYGFKMTEESS